MRSFRIFLMSIFGLLSLSASLNGMQCSEVFVTDLATIHQNSHDSIKKMAESLKHDGQYFFVEAGNKTIPIAFLKTNDSSYKHINDEMEKVKDIEKKKLTRQFMVVDSAGLDYVVGVSGLAGLVVSTTGLVLASSFQQSVMPLLGSMALGFGAGIAFVAKGHKIIVTRVKKFLDLRTTSRVANVIQNVRDDAGHNFYLPLVLIPYVEGNSGDKSINQKIKDIFKEAGLGEAKQVGYDQYLNYLRSRRFPEATFETDHDLSVVTSMSREDAGIVVRDIQADDEQYLSEISAISIFEETLLSHLRQHRNNQSINLIYMKNRDIFGQISKEKKDTLIGYSVTVRNSTKVYFPAIEDKSLRRDILNLYLYTISRGDLIQGKFELNPSQTTETFLKIGTEVISGGEKLLASFREKIDHFEESLPKDNTFKTVTKTDLEDFYSQLLNQLGTPQNQDSTSEANNQIRSLE